MDSETPDVAWTHPPSFRDYLEYRLFPENAVPTAMRRFMGRVGEIHHDYHQGWRDWQEPTSPEVLWDLFA